MLRITNGSVTLTVTKGAFNNYYKHCGFQIENRAEGAELEEVVTTQPNYTAEYLGDSPQVKNEEDSDDYEEDEDDEEIELSEIPLSEMSFEQLNEYADQLGLEHEGIRSKKELRAMIRSYLKR